MGKHMVVVYSEDNIEETCDNITRPIDSLYDVQYCPMRGQLRSIGPEDNLTIFINSDFDWHHSYLRQLDQIQSLTLIGADDVILYNIASLQYLPSIRELTIVGLIDMIPLGLIQSSMIELTIEHANIGILDVISNNTLHTLSLHDCQLTDIYGIQSLEVVEELFLESNHIVNINPLSGGLYKSLYLRRNNIHDISPLIECRDLEVIDISYNPVVDVNSLVHNDRLRLLIISDRFRNTNLEQLLIDVDIEYVMDNRHVSKL